MHHPQEIKALGLELLTLQEDKKDNDSVLNSEIEELKSLNETLMERLKTADARLETHVAHIEEELKDLQIGIYIYIWRFEGLRMYHFLCLISPVICLIYNPNIPPISIIMKLE